MNNDPAIARAEELLERLGSLDEVKRYYEAREMAIHDEVTRITGARAEGLVEGRAEGEAEGIVKGKLEGKLEAAQNLLSMGMSVQDIATATGLAVEQIEQLQRNSCN
jgi:predicted transposase/invertase (TIGR01784 family)